MKGFRSIHEIVAEWEADPEKLAYIVQARQQIAREFYKPGSPEYERLMRGEGPAPLKSRDNP